MYSFRLPPVLFLQRGRLQDRAGHQDHGPQAHRLAQHVVGVQARHDAGAGAVRLGPADVTVRLLHAAFDPGVGPVHQQSTHLRVARRHVAVVKAIQKRADEPADFLAHFPVAVAVAGVAEDVLFPACQPVLRRSGPAPWAKRWPNVPKMPRLKEQAARGTMPAATACLKNDRRSIRQDVLFMACLFNLVIHDTLVIAALND